MTGSDQRPLFDNELSVEIGNIFFPLCISPNSIEISTLISQVSSHIEQIHVALEDNEFLDIRTATKIANTVIDLLNRVEKFSQEHQKMIIGAARYFVLEDDQRPDTSDLLGFDDDLRVIKYVLASVGEPTIEV